MENKTIAVTIKIDYEKLENLLDSASRGAMYWCSGVDALGFESTVRKILYKGLFLKLKLLDDELNGKDRGFHLDLGRIKKGLAVMAKKQPSQFGDLMSDDYDQTTADVFLQCALLGEVVYG